MLEKDIQEETSFSSSTRGGVGGGAFKAACTRIRSKSRVWRQEKADDFDTSFTMLVKGCREAAEEGFLEAPIYNNIQIEAAWLFLFEVRRRHVNKRKQLQECIRALGASYNWSMALFGSRKVQDALRALPGCWGR